MPIELFPVYMIETPISDRSWEFNVDPGTGTVTYTIVGTTVADPTSIDPEVDPVLPLTEFFTREASITVTGSTDRISTAAPVASLKPFTAIWHRFDRPSDGTVSLVGGRVPQGYDRR